MTIVETPTVLEPIVPPIVSVGGHRRARPRVGTILATGWITFVVFTALTAQYLPIRKYDESFIAPLHQKPHWGWPEPLGADQLGRSILSRVVYGGRVTLAVGIFSVLLSLVVGGATGLIGGYFGGKLEYVLTTLTDAMLAFPPIVLLLTLRAVLVDPEAGRLFTTPKLVAILGLVSIPSFYRQTRAQVLARREKGFVLSAEALGAKRGRILFRELAPNVVLPVASIGFVVMAGLMIAEGSLSLLGFGIPDPQPSWGKMIADGKQNLQLGQNYSELIIPVVVLFLTVFSFNIVGEAARRKFDARLAALMGWPIPERR